MNRQPPRLRCTLVSSSLGTGPRTEDPKPRGTFKCNKSLCLTCKHVVSDVTLYRKGNPLNIFGHFNCGSSGVVYLIFCAKCPDSWYFGETCNPLRTRLNGHRRSITQRDMSVPVGKHFNEAGHDLGDLRVLIVRGGLKDTTTRKKVESEFIAKFSTHLDDGLNRDVGILSRFRSVLV